MKKTILAGATLVAMALSLSACGGKGDDKLGSEVESPTTTAPMRWSRPRTI